MSTPLETLSLNTLEAAHKALDKYRTSLNNLAPFTRDLHLLALVLKPFNPSITLSPFGNISIGLHVNSVEETFGIRKALRNLGLTAPEVRDSPSYNLRAYTYKTPTGEEVLLNIWFRKGSTCEYVKVGEEVVDKMELKCKGSMPVDLPEADEDPNNG